MRALTIAALLAVAAFLAMPAPNAEAGGLFFRDRAPARYAPAPAPVYYAPARVHYRERARTWCLFDWFRFDRSSRRW